MHYLELKIPNGTNVSDWKKIEGASIPGLSLMGISQVVCPAGLTQTSASIEFSMNGSNGSELPLYDEYGTALNFAAGANRIVMLPPSKYSGIGNYVRIKTPTNVSADRTFQVGIRAL